MIAEYPSFDDILVKRENGVLRVWINRPDALNSFTAKLYSELKSAFRLANVDDQVDIIVITGTGRSFATGGDLHEVLRRMNDENPLALYAYDDTMPFETLKECGKTTIAAVNGICVAGGLALASTCDFQIAVEEAKFGIPEARIGLASSLLPSLLLSKIGLTKLKHLLYTAKMISAAEAERIGLITDVVPAGGLDARVNSLIADIRGTSPVARALYNEYLNRMLPHAPTADLYRSMASPEVREGLLAFAQKRDPDYGHQT